MNTQDIVETWRREAREEGVKQGLEQGERKVLLRLLRRRFGAEVDGEMERRVAAAPAEQIEVWRRIIVGDTKSWVLFAGGTCVILAGAGEASEDLAARATSILREYGPVHAGSSAGDFGTISLDADLGWVVTGHHPDVLTYVAPEDVPGGASDLSIGLTGRSHRNQDAADLQIIHIEDRRPP